MLQQSTTLIETQTLSTFFHTELSRASANQSLPLNDEVLAYLTHLLTEFNRPSQLFEYTAEGVQQKALALHYLDALEAENEQQRTMALRRLGDIALFISGVFPSSLNRKVMDVDYYIAMGGTAYSYLFDVIHADVFAQLAENFTDLVDLLAEFADNTSLGSNTDLMRSYELWLRTGSPRLLSKLRRSGLAPAINNISTECH